MRDKIAQVAPIKPVESVGARYLRLSLMRKQLAFDIKGMRHALRRLDKQLHEIECDSPN